MTMIGNLIALQFGQNFNWPLGAAMSFVDAGGGARGRRPGERPAVALEAA